MEKRLYTEIPVVQKGCCGMPLRCTLLFWGYFRLPLSLFMLFVDLVIYAPYIQRAEHLTTAVMIPCIVLRLVCFVGTLVLIVAVHKKSLRLLGVVYRWELLSAAAIYISLLAGFLLSLQNIFEEDIAILIGLVYFGIQLYVVVLARSVIFMMESKQMFTVNSVDDVQYTCEE